MIATTQGAKDELGSLSIELTDIAGGLVWIGERLIMEQGNAVDGGGVIVQLGKSLDRISERVSEIVRGMEAAKS